MGSPKPLMGNSMKKITILLVIIFTFLFSTTSWGEWSYVSESVKGKMYYDKDRIRKGGKFIYFWMLNDLFEPYERSMSFTTYIELDCSIFRFRGLEYQFYSKSRGEGENTFPMTPDKEWRYPKPNTPFEYTFNIICEEHQ